MISLRSLKEAELKSLFLILRLQVCNMVLKYRVGLGIICENAKLQKRVNTQE